MYVTTIEDLIVNVNTLHNYHNDREHYDEYKQVIAGGYEYVAVMQQSGEFLFAPSRFVGYRDNTLWDRHEKDEMNGGKTTNHITKVLGHEEYNDTLEQEFLLYCNKYGIGQPHRKNRRYFPLITSDGRIINKVLEEEIVANVKEFCDKFDAMNWDILRSYLHNDRNCVVINHGSRLLIAPASLSINHQSLGDLSPIHYVGYNDPLTNYVVSRTLNQPFVESSFLDQQLNQYLKSKLKTSRTISGKKYIYFDLDDEFELEDYVTADNDTLVTEKTQKVKTRLGQSKYKSSMLSIWGKCMVTDCTNKDLLRASHAKPWRVSTNSERVDPYNGFLLVPNLDLLFDQGFITFSDKGEIMISDSLSNEDIEIMGLRYDMKIAISERHKPYIQYHRNHEFNKRQK